MWSYGQDQLKLSEKVASIVLAGGQGTRLFPLTQKRCKPAVSFGGRYRLIDVPISNSLNSHIYRIFVISQYFASSLQQHLSTTFIFDDFQKGQIEMLCPEETDQGINWFQGTADAVRQNIEHIRQSPVDYFLILSGDQLYNMNLVHMVEFAKAKDADLVIASLVVQQSEAKRMGLLKVDDNLQITDFYEKPTKQEILNEFQIPANISKTIQENHPSYLGSMGIYVFKREVLITLLQEKGNDFGKELIPLQVKKGKTFAYLYEGYWEDIGTVASYYHANLALTEQSSRLNTYDENNPIFTRSHHLPSPIIYDTVIKQSVISQGAIIEAKEIYHSVIGMRTHIKKGSIIRDSVILGNHTYQSSAQHQPLPIEFSIGENCLIEKAIIDEHSFIGNNVQLINKNHLDQYDGDGIYIRDGIIIVTSGTKIPDGFIL